MRAHITHHAAQRAVERLGLTDTTIARAHLGYLLDRAVLIPARVLRAITGRVPSARQKGAARFYVNGTVVMILKGGAVVTVWTLTIDQLAGLLVWAALKVT